jgi:DNA-binding transcriptional LysR family regulator
MNTDELQVFYWSGTLSSLSKAATRLRVSQPAITLRIQALEKELKADLFHRKPFMLTELGKRLLPLAERVVEAEGELRKELDPDTHHALFWRVGVIESALHSHLMSWLAQLESEQPGLRLELTVETTMRPMRAQHAIRAIQVTSRFPRVHGAPVHLGDPTEIGVSESARPDYGDAVSILPGEIPVFWPCGVTPQAAIEQAKPEICITHAPGSMLISDLTNSQLASF